MNVPPPVLANSGATLLHLRWQVLEAEAELPDAASAE
jgi:hypothetical protein